MEDKRDGPKKKVPVDISDQLINELEALTDAEKTTVKLTERDFPKREFPTKWNPNPDIWYEKEWNEKEIRHFYEDPENVRRTIFCKSINVDETDDWGMFGYTPGFIYIEELNYKGAKTLADKATSLGLSIVVDPKTGLGVMNHFDYFPKHKFEYELIKKSKLPDLFKLMCDIFFHKKISDQEQGSGPLLESGGEEYNSDL